MVVFKNNSLCSISLPASGGSAPPPAASGGRGSQGRGGRGRRVVRAPTAQGSRRNIRLKQPRKA